MGFYKDIFSGLTIGPALFNNLNVSAAGKLGLVLDRRDLEDPAGDLVGFAVIAHAIATATPTDFIKLVLHEADEKSDASTLINGAIVNVGTGTEGSGSDSDVLGYAVDGVREVIVNPAFDDVQPATTQTEGKFIQDGVFPLIDDTGLAGAVFWLSYRGYKDVLQFFAEKGPGSVSGNFTAFPITGSMRTRNLVNPVPNPAA